MNRKKHILLIDDDPMIHMSCEMILFGSQYIKTSIIDSDEAIVYHQFKDKYIKPDVILVDLMMGNISGIDVIKSIRSNSYFDKTPIFLFTGFHEKIMQDIELLKELNIAGVLSKPISKEQLFAKIAVFVDY